MARKYMKVEYTADESLIKNMIEVYKKNIRFIKVSYVRNDRVIDLLTNKVYLDEAPDQTYENTMNFYRHGGEIAVDGIENAVLDDEGKLILGKKVVLEMRDDVFKIEIESHIFANLEHGRFYWPDIEVPEFIESLKKIDGCTTMSNQLAYVSEFYPQLGTNGLSSVWHRINKFDLYSILGDFSKLILYANSIYHKEDSTDFFDSIKIPKEFLFRLTDYYLNPNDNNHSFFHGFQYEGYLWQFYEQLPDECKPVFLEEAKKERFDIANVVNSLSWRSGDLLAHISKSPAFFSDYLRKAKIHEEEDILTSYHDDAKNLLRYNMEFTLENLNNLKLVKKAEQMDVDLSQFFDMIGKLDTKQGILAYIMADKS